MEKVIKKSGLVAAVGLAAALQACSSGDSLVENLDPGSSGATITGTAVKGVLSDADCVATTTTGTTLYTSVGRTAACTSSTGSYNIPLMYNPTTPVLVEIRSRSSTAMKCDLPAGCAGGVAFGGDVSTSNLGSGFSMRAMVPSVTSNATSLTTNVNAFTDMAVNRAETVAGGVTGITSTTANDSYGEVASLLNNVLSTEGTSDAFTSSFYSVPATDMTNPTTEGVDAVATSIGVNTSTLRRQSALLSIASGSLLNLANDSKTVDSVLDDLSNSFSSDAQIDVNTTASNIAGDTVNLASIVRNIATTVSGLETSLTSNTTGLTALNTLLGSTSVTEGLTSIQTAAETLADQKDAVTDANLDPTAPLPVVSSALSTLDKSKSTVAKLINILNAGTTGLDADDDDDSADPVFVDVEDILATSTESYIDGLDYMALLMHGAAGMIIDKAFGEDDAFSGAGCTITGDDIECTAAQLAATLDDPGNDLEEATAGTIAYTHSTRTVVATGVVAEGHTLALTMVGNSSTTAPSYSVTSATIDLADDAGTTDVSFGTTTVSGVIASDVGQSFTIQAADVTIALADFTILSDVTITRDLTIRDTLITNFSLSGYIELASDATSSEILAGNRGERVTFTIAFQGNSASLSDTTSLPMPTEETATDFLAATGIELGVGYPTSVNVFDASTGQTASTATESVFSATFRGARDSVKNGDVESLTMKVIGANLNSSLTGDLTVVTTEPGGVYTQTTTWTLGDTDTTITLIFVETDSARSFSGTVATAAGVSVGTISSTGSISLTDPDTGETSALSIPTTLVSNLLVR